MRSVAELTEAFRERGLRVTPQRLCIFEVLEHNSTHPSAEAIYAEVSRRMPTVSLKTVYETLNQLAEMGEVSVLDLGTGQARFDPNTESGHHHLVCEVCGKVEDLRWDLEAPLEAMAGRGFEVHRVEAVVRGVCGSCLEGADRKDGFGRRRHGAAYEQDDNEQGGNNG